MGSDLPPQVQTDATYPTHSVDVCPMCECGLCGIRICGMDTEHPHGLVVCDECEAMWTVPNTLCSPQWRDAENPRCPICNELLWSSHSRWALREDLNRLGWQNAFDPSL